MAIDWISHKGKKILYSNYCGMAEEARIQQLSQEERVVLENPEPVLLLHNIGHIPASKTLMKVLKAQQASIRPKIARAACFGIAGIQYVFLTAVNRFGGTDMKPFTDESAALNWLVEASEI